MEQVTETSQPHTPVEEIGPTALIASLLTLLVGLFGLIIGYIITRGRSDYEVKFGSLLLRAHLGAYLYGTLAVILLVFAGGAMAYNDRAEWERVMDECVTVPTGTEPNNSLIIQTGSRTCEMSAKGEDIILDIVPKYTLFFIPFFIMGFYMLYVQIRFIVAAADKKLYRPVVTLGGKGLITEET
jgi:hypothetical protein